MAKALDPLSRPAVTPERLRELLKYEPTTGNLIWRVPRGVHGNGARPGDVAGYVAADGYVRVSVDDRRYLAHRLAWLWMLGSWPAAQIDHRNRNRSDNTWDNLRDATCSQNSANALKPRKVPLPRGVARLDGGSRFCAKIRLHRKAIYLGSFDTADEAHAAYLKAAASKFGAFLPVEASLIQHKIASDKHI